MFVELAQNAADAAASAGVPGRVRVRLVDGELRVANTGTPLDRTGVAALASLRASAKPERSGTVGRFGVGFAAVLSVTDEPRVVSRDAGVAFSAASTRRTVGSAPGTDVPVLRLPWPVAADDDPVPDGFDTEVRLPLRVPGRALLDDIEAEVADVLLVLPWLAEVDVEGRVWTRWESGPEVVLTAPDGTRWRWHTHRGEGCVWAVPVDDGGAPDPLDGDVLHAPTPTDERLSLPARLLSTAVPVEPSRRRVLAGSGAPDVTRALRTAAASYPQFVRSLPARHRLVLVPRPRFPLSDVDAVLREQVLDRLAAEPWLPSARSGELSARRARVLEIDSPGLVELLSDIVPGLVAAPLCGRGPARALTAVEARPLGAAGLVDAVTGVDRSADWWRRLYGELSAAVERIEVDVDELGALPVPLADGRTVPGARAVLLAADLAADAVTGDGGALDVPGLYVAHPDAVHPLLRRLGAADAGPAELLRAPAVVDAVARSVPDALAGLDVTPLAETVLSWVSAVGGVARPELGALALPGRSGPRRADELVLPDSPLSRVLHPEALGEDAPLDLADCALVERWGTATLRAVGVRSTFPVVEQPSDDEPGGGAALPVTAEDLPIADLDLVADDAWPAALRLLAAEPETWRALTAPDGRVRHWLSRNALLAGRPPRQWRLPSAEGLAGLFDPAPVPGLSGELLAVAGVRGDLDVADAEDAELLCDRLADAERTIPGGVVLRAHSALARAGEPGPVQGARLSPEDVRPPVDVRTLAGVVSAADDVVVLDVPWAAVLWPSHRLVGTAEFTDAGALADVLDLPLASEDGVAEPESEGDFVRWRELPAVVEVADLLGIPVPDGGLVVHDELVVGGRHVHWWHTGVPHAADSPGGLARAFAWATDRWPHRFLVERLLDDPDPLTVLT